LYRHTYILVLEGLPAEFGRDLSWDSSCKNIQKWSGKGMITQLTWESCW